MQLEAMVLVQLGLHIGNLVDRMVIDHQNGHNICPFRAHFLIFTTNRMKLHVSGRHI